MQEIRYGQIKGGEIGYEHLLAASQAVLPTSGHFVYRTGASTDSVTLATDGTAELLGWMECESIASSTGKESRKIINDLTAVFRMPIDSGTYTHLMEGKTCDLNITSSIQGAGLDQSDEDTLVIVGGDIVDNKWVDVMLNPNKMFTVGVV